MSEKGQGEGSTEGTGVGIDGTPPAGGGGSAADQSGPHEGDTQTRGRGEWSYDDPDLGELKASDAPPPPLPEDGAAAEPDIPGGGPTDTRSGWDYPNDTGGPRGEPAPYAEPGGAEPGPSRPGHESADPGRTEGPHGPLDEDSTPQMDPPNLESSESHGSPTDRPPGLTDEQFEQWKKAHPSILDSANTQTDVT